ncbi:MAG: hypothetical protein ACRDUX_20440 [Mycobacterium sp.]
MRRWIAVLWHASFFVLAGVLYFFFVLPRWFELTGAWPSGLGLAMRIVCGALIGLAALPVVFTLLRTRKPEFGTPQLALTLRFWSIVLHVLAGALIIGAAISEIWVSLDAAGQTLFGIYGAAAAVAVLGALSFYLAFAAELPPPPPKPLKLKSQTRRRRGGAAEEEADEEVADEDTVSADSDEPEPSDSVEPDENEDEDEKVPAPVSVETTDEVSGAAETTEASATESPSTDGSEGKNGSEGSGNVEESDDDEPGDTLRNRRPGGKSTSRLFGRSRRGIALDD